MEKIVNESVQGTALTLEMKNSNSRKLYIESYGCAMNFSDSEIVASVLNDSGYEGTDNEVDADLLNHVLNSKDFRARAAAVKVLRYSSHQISNQADLLMTAAKDENPRVRLEAFVAASWVALGTGLIGYIIGLTRADMLLNEKGYYFTIIMFGLFSVVSLQKAVRDKLEDIKVTDTYYNICWFASILSIVLLVVGLWNAELLPSEKGFYAFAFLLVLFLHKSRLPYRHEYSGRKVRTSQRVIADNIRLA